jgi:hypothetical protein
MAPSIEAQIKQRRRQLVTDGVHDPFELLARALQRNEELQAQVEALQRIVKARRGLVTQQPSAWRWTAHSPGGGGH